MSNQTKHQWKFETLQLHVGQEQPDPASDAKAVPIYQTTSYVFRNSKHAADRFGLADAGNIYGRLTNSTQGVFEKRIAALESGTAALAVAFGVAAVTYSILNLVQSGDHVASTKTIHGGTYNLPAHTLLQYGITTTFMDPDEEGASEVATQGNTKATFIESLGNPNSNIIDAELVAGIAHKHGIPSLIDSTFTPPSLFRPIEYGADIVTHSAIKFIGGHGTTLGGVIVDSDKFDWAAPGKFPGLTEPTPSCHGLSSVRDVGAAALVTRIRAILLRDTGSAISLFNAFLPLQGLETFSPCVECHAENSLKALDSLKSHPKVEHINHPVLSDSPYHVLYGSYLPNGAGSILTFEAKGGVEEVTKFIDNPQLLSLLANVVDAKSLVTHPAFTTYSQLNAEELLNQGTKPNTARFSIGTEHINDIIYDLQQAFDTIRSFLPFPFEPASSGRLFYILLTL